MQCVFPYQFCRIVPFGFQLFYFIDFCAENIVIFLARKINDLYIRAVHCSASDRAVHHEFHIARAACFKPCCGNLQRYVRSRHNFFCVRYVIVLYKHNFQKFVRLFIRIKFLRNLVDKLDYRLSAFITRCALCPEHEHRRLKIFDHPVLQTPVYFKDRKSCHELPFVFMQSLDL